MRDEINVTSLLLPVAKAAEYLYHANELELSDVEMNKAWQSLREALMKWHSGEIQASRDYFNSLVEAAWKRAGLI